MAKLMKNPLDMLEYPLKSVDTLMNVIAADAQQQPEGTPLLANFLRHQLKKHGWTHQQFAERIDCDVLVVRAILTGRVPAQEFDPDFMRRIALAVEYDVSTIEAMIGLQPSPRETLKVKENEANDFMQSFADILFETLDKRYSPEVMYDADRAQQYESLVHHLEQLIVKQRRELRFVESLKAKLKDPNAAIEIEMPTNEANASIVDISKHLNRIIQHLKEA